MAYWLLKTEPDVFSIADLQKKGQEMWDGVRNYQARNYMRDLMKPGDGIFIYHSRVEPIGIAGQAKVVGPAYPDPTQFDPKSKYYDAKSNPEDPRWFLVDVAFVARFPRVITLAELKATPGLEKMVVTQKGSRLSVQPVRPEEWDLIQHLIDAP